MGPPPPPTTPTTPTSTPLLAAHAAVHHWLEERAYDALAALVQLDVAKARAQFDAFARVLDEHMAWENEHVMPRYKERAPADGAGRADHIEGDHTILVRHVDSIGALFGELEGTPTLRAILEELPVFYRLIGTLEHHTMREQTYVYSRDDLVDAGAAVAALEALVR